MPLLRSGDIPRIAPGWNNTDGFKSVHLIHPDLAKYFGWGVLQMTYVGQESTQLSGDRRLYAIGLPTATWGLSYVTRCALDAILDHVDFNGLDCLVTVRTWVKNDRYRNFNAVMSYLPKADQRDNPFETFAVEFTFNDMKEVV